jgi:hypothetical protein
MPTIIIGSIVATKNGPMHVMSTRRFTGTPFVGVVLLDSDGAQWLTRVRVGKNVNRTNKLVPND